MAAAPPALYVSHTTGVEPFVELGAGVGRIRRQRRRNPTIEDTFCFHMTLDIGTAAVDRRNTPR